MNCFLLVGLQEFHSWEFFSGIPLNLILFDKEWMGSGGWLGLTTIVPSFSRCLCCMHNVILLWHCMYMIVYILKYIILSNQVFSWLKKCEWYRVDQIKNSTACCIILYYTTISTLSDELKHTHTHLPHSHWVHQWSTAWLVLQTIFIDVISGRCGNKASVHNANNNTHKCHVNAVACFMFELVHQSQLEWCCNGSLAKPVC